MSIMHKLGYALGSTEAAVDHVGRSVARTVLGKNFVAGYSEGYADTTKALEARWAEIQAARQEAKVKVTIVADEVVEAAR